MTDFPPPRLVAGDRETVLALLQYVRDSVVRKVEGLDEAVASRRLVDSDTTLLWLVQHLRFAEILWFVQRFQGEPFEDPPAPAAGEDALAAAIDAYRAAWARVDAIVAAASLDDWCRDVGTAPPVNLRWVLMHMVEESADAGHADILRELTTAPPAASSLARCVATASRRGRG